MEESVASSKDMMLKLKRSFSLKSFSSASYRTSLICKSKTICLNVNLIDGRASTSTKDCFVSNCRSKISVEASSKDDRNLNSENKNNKNEESSKSGKIKELSNTALESSAGDGKLSIETRAKRSRQVKSSQSSNPTQSSSEFESFRCDVCMKYFSSKRNVRRHALLHSPEYHPCKNCGKMFKTKENLKRHFRAIHEVKVQCISCFYCYKAFWTKKNLKIHLEKHPNHVQ